MDEKCPKCGSTNVEEINYIIREDGEKIMIAVKENV